MKTPPSSPKKSHAGQLLLEGFVNNWQVYLTELERCKTEFSNEAVHDLRVATQKITRMVQLLKVIFPRPRLHKINQALEAQLADLDGLRNIQVVLAEISEMIQELPELNAFQEQQQVVEEKALRVARKKIKRFEHDDLSRRIRKERHFLETQMENNLEPELLQAVDNAFQLANRRFAWVNPARNVTIQRVGAAFQDFRYAVEVVHPLITNFPAVYMEGMRRYQSLIHEIQDTENFLQVLAGFSDHASLSEMGVVRHYYECRYEEVVAAYTAQMDQLHLFWRHMPDQPFPWNQNE